MGFCNLQFETIRKPHEGCIRHKFVAAVNGATRYAAVFSLCVCQALAVHHTLGHTRSPGAAAAGIFCRRPVTPDMQQMLV